MAVCIGLPRVIEKLRQIYYDLDDANNRLRVVELREKFFNEIRDILQSPRNRQQLSEAYSVALQTPISLVDKGSHSLVNASKAIAREGQLRRVPPDGDWGQRVKDSDFCIEYLDATRQALVSARNGYAEFTQQLDPREFFFPVYDEYANSLVPGMEGAWIAWVSDVEVKIGHRLTQLCSLLQNQSQFFDQREKELAIAIQEAKQLRITHQLGHATAYLVQITQAFSVRFEEFQRQFSELTIFKKETDPTRTMYVCLILYQLKDALSSELSLFQEFIRTNSEANNERYFDSVSKRFRAINASEDIVSVSKISESFRLLRDIERLKSDVDNSIKICENLLDKAIRSDTGFQKLDQYVHKLLTESQIQEIELLAVDQPSGGIAQLVSSLKSDARREIDRRRRVLNSAISVYVKTNPKPKAPLPDVPNHKIFPALLEIMPR